MELKIKTMEDKSIEGSDFTHTSLAEQAFVNCIFQKCNFTESVWHNAKFQSCLFKECNLSLLKIDGCRLQEIIFEDCKVVGVNFFKCDTHFFSIKARNNFFQYCNFADLNMKQVSFYGSKIKDCHFTATSLIEADFGETDLSGTVFHNCDLTKSDFCGAKNYAIDVRTNKVKKAKFSFPEAISLLQGLEIDIVK